MTSTRESRMRLLETRDDPVPVSTQWERLLAITVGETSIPETEPESQATPKASRVSLWESLAWRGRFFVGVLALLQIYMFVTMALVVILSTIAFGWTSVVITSGSMSPTISTGDVVLASPHNGGGLSPGTVVVFYDPARPGLVTHRIDSVNPDGSYVTKGDANTTSDSTPLEPEEIVGVGRTLVPWIGRPLAAFWAGKWATVAIWVVGGLLATWLARYALLDRYHPGHRHEVSWNGDG